MTQSAVLVDAHVHIYPVFNTALLLGSAATNFTRHAAAKGLVQGSLNGVLLLAETAACDWFNAVVGAGGWSEAGWTVAGVQDDDVSLLAQGPDDQKLLLIAGRQVATREGLEVLTLCSRIRVADRQSLEETITLGLDAGAVVVLPWAVGKWLGGRGKLIRQALNQFGQQIFVGDNGGRPWVWPAPAFFTESERRDRPVISGSDPLPLRGAERGVGSLGLQLNGFLPESRPGPALRQRLLAASAGSVEAFGRLATVSNFFRSQVMLRLP